MTITAPAPTIKRDRYGRPLVIPPEGGKEKPYRRVTTFIDVLESRYALELWKQRQVAYGLALRHDLLLKAASASGDKTVLNEVVKAAEEAAGSSQAATTGIALHSITEQLDRGEDPLIPPSAQPDVDAYRKTTAHLSMSEIEVFVVHDELQAGGTFDRIVTLPDGTRVVADIKTGKIDYGASKIAMQLAIYAHSEIYHPGTGERAPLGAETTRGLVIHLPAGAGECSLHWCDLDQGWEGVKIAAQVWQWRSRSGLLAASEPSPAPDLVGLIDMAGDRASLEALWADHERYWTEIHTAAAKQRITQLEDSSPTSV